MSGYFFIALSFILRTLLRFCSVTGAIGRHVSAPSPVWTQRTGSIQSHVCDAIPPPASEGR